MSINVSLPDVELLYFQPPRQRSSRSLSLFFDFLARLVLLFSLVHNQHLHFFGLLLWRTTFTNDNNNNIPTNNHNDDNDDDRNNIFFFSKQTILFCISQCIANTSSTPTTTNYHYQLKRIIVIFLKRHLINDTKLFCD